MVRRCRRPSRAVRFALVCGLVTGSLLFSAVVCEVFLRFLGYRGEPTANASNVYEVDDPVLDWRYVPHSEFVLGQVVSRYNSLGFRDDGHELVKRPGIRRVVALGDSVTEGFGVEWNSVFARVLQRELGDGYEVINLAMRGLNTPQEVHLLATVGLAFDPDIVILNFVLNDGDFASSLKAGRIRQPQADSRIHVLNIPINPQIKRRLKESAFLYFVKQRLENLRGRLFDLEDRDYLIRLWDSEASRHKIRSGFARLHDLRVSRRFEVVVMIWPVVTDYSRYPYRHIHDWVLREAEARGFVGIDLLPAYSRVSFRKLQVSGEDGLHPNRLGHRMAAEAFLAWLRANRQHSRPPTLARETFAGAKSARNQAKAAGSR